MTHSLNEVEVTLKRAAVGAGLPVGLAEEVGAAGAWLCARGHDGVAAAVPALAGDLRALQPEPARDGSRLVFSDARVAVCGPSAVDMAATGRCAGTIVLRAADAPFLLAGLAGVAAQGVPIVFTLGFARGGRARVSGESLATSGPLPGPGGDVVISGERTAGSPAVRVARVNGVDVDARAWRAAEVLAALTYTPSSESSRLGGAGAGLTDND